MSAADPTSEELAAMRRLVATDRDETMTSLLQWEVSGLDTPLAFLRESNGYDLHAVQWWADPSDQSLLHFDFSHLQYDDSAGMPSVTVIAHSDDTETVRAPRADSAALMQMSRQLVERYQSTIRIPDPQMPRPLVTYMQTGIVRPGEEASLFMPGSGQPAREWPTLLQQTVLDQRAKRKERIMTDNNSEPASRETPQAATTEEKHEPRKAWPRVNVPNAFVHPYIGHASDGRTFDKMIISMPGGTKLNGVDVTGWSLDRFMSKASRDDKANGCPVTLTFQPDKALELFKGRGESRQSITINDPWILCTAVKKARDDYAAKRNAERSTDRPAKEQPDAGREPTPSDRDSTDMTGRDFLIEFNRNETEVGHVKAASAGLDKWEVTDNGNRLGHVVRNDDDTYTAYTNPRPEGVKCADPVSAARLCVADSAIAYSMKGEIHTIPAKAQPLKTSERSQEKGTRKSFLEQMNDVTREKFAGRKFGDDVTANLKHTNQVR